MRKDEYHEIYFLERQRLACRGQKKDFTTTFNDLDADFFCIQETKMQEGQLDLDLPGYEQYYNYAERKGYSGTAIFTKHHPLAVTYDIGEPDFDHEGRVITLEYPDFYLVTCYTPNSGSGLKRLDFRMGWEDVFQDYLDKLNASKPVILCGDLNVAHEEIDLKKTRRQIIKTLALPMTNGKSSPRCLAAATRIRSVTLTRKLLNSTHGGVIGSMLVITTLGGGSTILLQVIAFKRTLKRPKFETIFSGRTTVPLSLSQLV